MKKNGRCQVMYRQDQPSRRRTHRLVWGLVPLLMVILVPVAMGQPAVNDLLGKLRLSGYDHSDIDMRPPPFKSHTMTGRQVSLADLKGRVVVVTFWASWCAECRPEMPMFERLHQDFAAQGLTVLGINFQEDVAVLQRYAKGLDLTFPLLLDPQGEIFRLYGVIGLPSTFLIGRDGRTVALAVGPRPWGSAEARALIRALLAESVVE